MPSSWVRRVSGEKPGSGKPGTCIKVIGNSPTGNQKDVTFRQFIYWQCLHVTIIKLYTLALRRRGTLSLSVPVTRILNVVTMGDRRREVRREEKKKVDGMGDLESPEGSPGSRSGWLDSRFPRSRLGVGKRRGLSTPFPWKRGYRPTGTRDSGIGTIGTRRLGWTGENTGDPPDGKR